MAKPSENGASPAGADGNGASEAPRRLSQVLARLEEIRRELDREDLDLEDQMVLYREGCTLAASAKRLLDTARAEVEFLMDGADAPAPPPAG